MNINLAQFDEDYLMRALMHSKKTYQAEHQNSLKKKRIMKKQKILSKSRSSRLSDHQNIIQNKGLSEVSKFEQFTIQTIKQETFNISQLGSLFENIASLDPIKAFYGLNGVYYLMKDNEGKRL